MSIIRPQTIPVERTRAFQDEWAHRFGVLMGGTKTITLAGIGQYWIGHAEIPRRQLVEFTRQQVRARNEAADGDYLDNPGGAILGPSPLDSERLIDKSPALCMQEMMQMYAAKGFINSQTLMGDEKNAERIFSVVLPSEIAVLPLVDVLDFLEQREYIDKAFMDGGLRERAHLFREEAVQGGYIAKTFMVNYTDSISEEISQSAEKKTGKRSVDVVDREYFWELKKTLPENRPLEATTNLGKEIAKAFAGKGGDTSELVAAMTRQNELQAEANELRRQELARSASVETKRGPGRPPKTDKGE